MSTGSARGPQGKTELPRKIAQRGELLIGNLRKRAELPPEPLDLSCLRFAFSWEKGRQRWRNCSKAASAPYFLSLTFSSGKL